MIRKICAVAMVMVGAAAVTALAGERHACTASTQECLDYMKAHLSGRGWVGIEYEQDDMKVVRVIEGSPAQRAGFRKGDVLVGVNGVDFVAENHDRLMKMQETLMKPGNNVTYTVRRAGKLKSLDVRLVKVPEEVLAQWVGSHMLKDHATDVKIASNG